MTLGSACIEGKIGLITRRKLTSGNLADLSILEAPLGEKSLDFIPEATRNSLTRLVVTDWSVSDVTAVSGMRCLEDVILYVDSKVDIKIPELVKSFVGRYSKHFVNLFELPDLQTLELENPPPDVFSKVANLRSLTTLRLKGARKVKHVPDVGLGIQDLEIALARLEDPSGLASFTNLKRLYLNGTKFGPSLDFLAGHRSIEELELDDCGEIDSLEPLFSTPLQRLLFVGETKLKHHDDRGRDFVRNLKYYQGVEGLQ